MGTKTVGTANVRITGSSKGLQNELRKSQSGIQKFKSSAIAGFKAGAIGIGVMTVALAGLTRAVESSVKQLDGIAKSARTLGITTTAYQELVFAAGQAGMEQAQFTKGMLSLGKASSDAQFGLTTMQRAFEQMGISIDELKGLNPGDLLELVADRIGSIQNPTERSAVLVQILGKRMASMMNLFKDGAQGIRDLREQAQKLGIVFDKDLVAGAEESNDRLTITKRIINAQWVKIWADLAPMVISTSESFAKFARELAPSVELLLNFSGAVENLSLDALQRQLENQKEVASDYAKRIKDLKASYDDWLTFGEDGRLERLSAGEEKNRLEIEKTTNAMKQKRAALKALTEANNKKAAAESGTGVSTINAIGGGGSKKTKLDEIITPVEKQRVEQMRKNKEAEDQRVQDAKDANDKIAADTESHNKMINGAVDNLGRALSDAAASGTLDFKDMFKSIIAGAFKAQMQIALIGKASQGGIAGGGGLLGGAFKIGQSLFSNYVGTPQPGQSNFVGPVQPGRAGGGRVFAGQSYTVGELRAETFRPDVNGRISPSAGGGGNTKSEVKVNITNNGQPKTAQVNIVEVAGKIALNMILTDLDEGGKISKTLGANYGVSRKA